MSEVLFVGGPWNRTKRQVNNSGDLIAEHNGQEVFYTGCNHEMPSGNFYRVALSPDADIQDIPTAIRETGHRPFK